jgi:hypothetical protein
MGKADRGLLNVRQSGRGFARVLLCRIGNFNRKRRRSGGKMTETNDNVVELPRAERDDRRVGTYVIDAPASITPP